MHCNQVVIPVVIIDLVWQPERPGAAFQISVTIVAGMQPSTMLSPPTVGSSCTPYHNSMLIAFTSLHETLAMSPIRSSRYRKKCMPYITDA